MKLDTKPYEEKMQKTIAAFNSDIATIRVGKANARVLDKVTVDYYGSPTPVSQMAELKVPEPRTLLITPWDASTLKAIEKAIMASDVGITPQNDGKSIRLIFPQLTEERRKELTKQVAKRAEEAKVALRNIRRDANDHAKDLKKKGEMTEDEQRQSDKLTQDLTDKYIKEVDDITAAKNKDIMSL